MLQLRQLESVAARFPQEIEMLRTFIRSAEPRPYAYGSLAAVASQIRQAGRFHRDLASHLMVFTHEGISPPDLLGIVALAAGELNGAAAARESDAHTVLRFILTGPSANSGDRVPHKPATMQVSSRWAWSAVAVCVGAGLLGTVYLRHGAGVSSQQQQLATHVPLAASQPSPSLYFPPANATALSRDTPINAVPSHKASSHGTLALKPGAQRSMSHQPAVKPEALQPEQPLLASRTTPISSPEHYAPIVRMPASPTTQAVETRMLGSNGPRGVLPIATPAAVLSQRLDARSLPANDPAIDPYSGRAYPRLWRRRPEAASTSNPAESTVLYAANAPPSKPGTNLASGASAGIVRPVSLGMMAANILYSPAPTYPAAAAMAHVHGQVKIEAEVDRDGSVASARVVSGPPLLRDAALDAVLRWRYRPRTLAGKPVTAADTAVLDFELP